MLFPPVTAVSGRCRVERIEVHRAARIRIKQQVQLKTPVIAAELERVSALGPGERVGDLIGVVLAILRQIASISNGVESRRQNAGQAVIDRATRRSQDSQLRRKIGGLILLEDSAACPIEAQP
jgi:hypothetical protein